MFGEFNALNDEFKKLLDAPTNRLRAQANTPSAPDYADVARTLFGLSTGD